MPFRAIAAMGGVRRGLLAAAFGTGLAFSTNPFAGDQFYLNPVNQAEYDKSIASATDPDIRSNLERMRGIASAYWIDKKEKIRGKNTTRTVEGILADAASKPQSELVVLIWYDFPNRDCAAAASAGEICCAYNDDGTCDWGNGGDCATGIEEYKTGYVDPFIEVLAEYKGKVRVAIIFEPDSLPNFATNMDKPHCGSEETRNAYTKGAKYALNELVSKTDAAVYIDAAHGGWLGWHKNIMSFMGTLKELDVPFGKIRGFSTNVAGYEGLGEMCPWEPDDPVGSPHRNGFCLNGKNANHPCCEDPCGLLGDWDPAQNEMNYAQMLHHAAKKELGIEAHIVIDTGRNGVPDARSDCANWCNIRNAGAGHASTSQTDAPGMVDAYFYLKTPGESDGCTQTLPDGSACPRFDTGCGKVDAIGSRESEPRAPEAGGWFDYQVKQLAEFANFGESIQARSPIEKARHTVKKIRESLPVQVPAVPAIPVPEVPSVPELLKPTQGEARCCWGNSCGSTDNCAPAGGWCSQSKEHCTTSCGGMWCAPSVSLADVDSSKSRRNRRLRARGLHSDNVMLQKFRSHIKRSASADIEIADIESDIEITDQSSKDEL